MRKYGWLGGKGRRTELASGVVQMGVRSYVPAMGRFTSVDPVLGGSANAYEYAMGDPVNMFDLDGQSPKDTACFADFCTCYFSVTMTSRRRGRMRIRMTMRCARAGTHKVGGFTKYEQHKEGDHCFIVCDHFESWTPQIVVPWGEHAQSGGCRDCGRNWDIAFTVICEPGREYQIVKMHQVLLGWGPNGGQEVSKVVRAQEHCAT